MKKFLIQMVAILIVIFGLLAYSTGRLPQYSLTNTPKVNKIHIDNTDLQVEIVDSPDERKKGLGGRDSLAADAGMLFKFDKPDYYNIWMKSMNFPIDIIWIRDNKIVSIVKNAPPQATGQADTELPIYTPSELVDSVLEVNAGFADTHSLKEGDTIQIL